MAYPCGLSPLPCRVMWADDSSSLHPCYLISIPKGSCESQADDVLQGCAHSRNLFGGRVGKMFPVFISMNHSLLNFINEPTWGRRCVRKLTELHRAFPFPSSFSGSVTQAQHLPAFPLFALGKRKIVNQYSVVPKGEENTQGGSPDGAAFYLCDVRETDWLGGHH